MKEGKICIKKVAKEELTTKLPLWMRLVDFKYNFECGWLIELSNKKLSTKKLSYNNRGNWISEKEEFFFKSNNNGGNSQ